MKKDAALKGTLLFAASLTVMAGATISPSLPALRDHFVGTPNVEVLTRLILTIPALAIIIAAPFVGWIIDRAGRLPVLRIATVLYVVAGLSGLVLNSLGAILIGRFLLGAAVGGVLTTNTTLIGDYFEGRAREKYLGSQAAFIGVGGLVFLSLGGFLAEVHWRAPFAVYGLAVLLLPLSYLFLTEPDRADREKPRPTGAMSPPAAPLWIVPLLYLAAFANMITFYMIPTQLPFLLIDTLGIGSPLSVGAAIGSAMLFSAGGSMLFPFIRPHLPTTAFFAAGFGGAALGYLLISQAGTLLAVMVGMAIIGVGMGLMFPALTTTLLGAAPAHLRGRLSGGMTASLFLGQFLSPVVSQPLSHAVGLQGMYLVTSIPLAIATLVLIGVSFSQRRQVSPA